MYHNLGVLDHVDHDLGWWIMWIMIHGWIMWIKSRGWIMWIMTKDGSLLQVDHDLGEYSQITT